MNDALTLLGRLSLEASALILLVLAARHLLGPKLTAGWRVALWGLVALKLLLPAVLPIGFGVGKMSPPQHDQLTVAKGTARADFEAVTTSAAVVGVADERARWHPSSVLATLWLTGALGVLTITWFRHRKFLRTLPPPQIPSPDIVRAARQAQLPAPFVRNCPQAVVPSVVGFRKPTLIVPATPVQPQVILHELFHIKHHDLAINWLWLALQALHWFNPLVWLAAARCMEDRELRCDDKALACSSNAERIAYGRELIRLQETFQAPPALAVVAACVRNHPPLRQRILMITKPTTTSRWTHLALSTIALALTIVFFGTASAQEKERSRAGERTDSANTNEETRKPSTAREDGEKGTRMKEGERGGKEGERGAKEGEREGGKKTMREGDREGAKTGPRDGEGEKRGPKDGDAAKRGAKDGDGEKRGPRDGEGEKRGSRDGEREGGSKTMKSERDSAAGGNSGEFLQVVVLSDEEVQIGKEKVSMNKLRAFLGEFLPEHRGAKIGVKAADDVPFKTVANVIDALRDNGAKNASIQAE